MSCVNGLAACAALDKLCVAHESIRFDGAWASGVSSPKADLEQAESAIWRWLQFCYPEESTTGRTANARRGNSRKRSPRSRKKNRSRRVAPTTVRKGSSLRDCLAATKRRVSTELGKLVSSGIHAKIHNDTTRWRTEPSLWITFSVSHPLKVYAAAEKLWAALRAAFLPDQGKLVRTSVLDYLWSKIVAVPLVDGRSLCREAYANYKWAAQGGDQAWWQQMPEEIPFESWAELGVPEWKENATRGPFGDFRSAYLAAFGYIDHIEDFNRCVERLDEDGEAVLLDHIKSSMSAAGEKLVEASIHCDAAIDALKSHRDGTTIQESDANVSLLLLQELRYILDPASHSATDGNLSMDELSTWRDELAEGVRVLENVRSRWTAHFLGLPSFPESGPTSGEHGDSDLAVRDPSSH